MLRVLVLSTLFPDASRPNFGIFVERQSLALASRDDVELQVVAPVGIPPWPLSRLSRYRHLSKLPAREDWKGLPVHRPRFRNWPATDGRFHAGELVRSLAPYLADLRRDFPFDLIAAEFFFPDGPAAVSLGKRLGVPVSIKARGSDIHRWAARPAAGAQIRAAGAQADGLIAVSEPMRRDLIALGMPEERTTTIVTGVDFSRFGGIDRAAAKQALGIAGPLVLSLGALIPLKGHEIVIDAVARLPGVTLWIAGEGPHRPALARHIARAGLGERVRLLGAVPHGEIPTYLAAADVMALASEREGLANAWLEALASGTPVVIPVVGGAPQVVRSPVAGRLVPRTADAFAEAIGALIADPPDPAAVRATVERFTWAENSASLHRFFSKLLAERQPIGTGPSPTR
jgi:teichuronic acid biosynthesis glycosyltransferase TuaC